MSDWQPKLETMQVLPLSTLCEGFSSLEDQILENIDVSFGDAAATLISPACSQLHSCLGGLDDEFADAVEVVLKRLEQLPEEGMYIGLEG